MASLETGNALRYTNACISRGQLQRGFVAKFGLKRGNLKLIKGSKKMRRLSDTTPATRQIRA